MQDAFGVTAGLTFTINDTTTTFNIEGGYAQNVDADQNVLLTVDNVVTPMPTSCGNRSSRCAWAGK